MNNNHIYTTYNSNDTDPNKKKKCSCEDKYGPKPFSSNANKQTNNKTN